MGRKRGCDWWTRGLTDIERKSISDYLSRISSTLFAVGFVAALFKSEFSFFDGILICGVALLFKWLSVRSLPSDDEDDE